MSLRICPQRCEQKAVLRNLVFWSMGSRLSDLDQPSSTMALERAAKIATYANLVEQVILDLSGAGASCSPREQELLASIGKDRPASITRANRVPGLQFSFKTVTHPVNELLEASTNLSSLLRIIPPAGD